MVGWFITLEYVDAPETERSEGGDWFDLVWCSMNANDEIIFNVQVMEKIL